MEGVYTAFQKPPYTKHVPLLSADLTSVTIMALQQHWSQDLSNCAGINAVLSQEGRELGTLLPTLELLNFPEFAGVGSPQKSDSKP